MYWFFLTIFLFFFFLRGEIFIEPYFKNKGYEIEKDFSIQNKNIKISLSLYSPIIEINKEIYFLRKFPFIGNKGISLTEGDFRQLKRWLSFYEKYYQQYHQWNSLKKNNSQNKKILLQNHQKQKKQSKKQPKKKCCFFGRRTWGKRSRMCCLWLS